MDTEDEFAHAARLCARAIYRVRLLYAFFLIVNAVAGGFLRELRESLDPFHARNIYKLLRRAVLVREKWEAESYTWTNYCKVR